MRTKWSGLQVAAMLSVWFCGCAGGVQSSPRSAAAPKVHASSCARQYGPALSEPKASAELITARGTSLDAYNRADGAWLPRAPVLVNRDFDFAMAMALEGGLGAGLAAAQRKQGNEQAVLALKDVVVDAELARALEEERRCGLHTYFLLWGADKQTLSLISEVPGSTTHELLEGATLAADAWMARTTLQDELHALFEQHRLARAK